MAKRPIFVLLNQKPILKDEFSGEIVKHLDYDFSKFDKTYIF